MPRLITLAASLCLLTLSATAQVNFGPRDRDSYGTVPVTVTIPATTAYTTIQVVTMGATGLDFQNAGTGTCRTGVTYSAGQTCTIGVAIHPLQSGLRMGAIVLSNPSAGIYNTIYLQAIGTGPQLAFAPGIATMTDPSLNGKSVSQPSGIAIDGTGTVFVVDPAVVQGSLLKLPPNNGTPSAIVARGSSGDYVTQVQAVAIDGAGNRIVAGEGIHGVALAVRIPIGGNTGQEYTDEHSTLGLPFQCVAVDGAGNIFVAYADNGEVIEYPSSPNVPPIYFNPAPDGLAVRGAFGLAVDLYDNIYLTDDGNQRIVEIPGNGSPAIALTPVVDGTQVAPFSLAVDGVGNLYIGDSARIVELPVNGGPAFAIQNASPTLNLEALALSLDTDGNLYAAEGYNVQGVLKLQRSTAEINFPLTQVGANSSDSPHTIVVQNVGTSTLGNLNPVYPPNFPEDNFADPTACRPSTTLATGQTCNLTIDFHPLEPGTFSETIALSDPGYNYVQGKVTLNGTGTNALLSAYSLNYGSQVVNETTKSQQVTLTNGGSTPLAITGVRVTGANAASFIFATDCPARLPAGQSCTIHGHFTPTTTGPLTAQVTVTDGESDSPQTIALTGTGVNPPIVTLSTTSLAFGTAQVGTASPSQYLTLTNTGASNLIFSSISTTGPNASSFAASNDCYSPMPPNGSCTIGAHFTPKTTGALTAAITIKDNATGSTQQITLSGTGTAASATASVTPKH